MREAAGARRSPRAGRCCATSAPPARRCCRWASCAASTPATSQLRQAIDDGTVGAPCWCTTSAGASAAPRTPRRSSRSPARRSTSSTWCRGCCARPWSRCRGRRRAARRRSTTGLQDPQLIHLRTADGVLSTCETFLNARYGYDVRCEVVGETGAISLTEPARVRLDAGQRHGIGYAADWRPRFADAYRIELQAWVDAVLAGGTDPARDGPRRRGRERRGRGGHHVDARRRARDEGGAAMTFPRTFPASRAARPDGRARPAVGRARHRLDRRAVHRLAAPQHPPAGRRRRVALGRVGEGVRRPGRHRPRARLVRRPRRRPRGRRRLRRHAAQLPPRPRPARAGRGQARAGGEADRAERGGGRGDRGRGRPSAACSAPRRCGRSTCRATT